MAFIPGSPFFASGEGERFIRLNFTYAPVDRIGEGIRLLCRAMRDLMNEKRVSDVFVEDVAPLV